MNTFSATVDAIQLEGGFEAVTDIWNEIGESHAKRRIPRSAFLELREVVVEILSAVCKLDNDGKVAWTAVLDYIYAAVFEKLGNN